MLIINFSNAFSLVVLADENSGMCPCVSVHATHLSILFIYLFKLQYVTLHALMFCFILRLVCRGFTNYLSSLVLSNSVQVVCIMIIMVHI